MEIICADEALLKACCGRLALFSGLTGLLDLLTVATEALLFLLKLPELDLLGTEDLLRLELELGLGLLNDPMDLSL